MDPPPRFEATELANPSLFRSVKETLIRSFMIDFIAAANVGHLIILRNFLDKRSPTLFLYIIDCIPLIFHVTYRLISPPAPMSYYSLF